MKSIDSMIFYSDKIDFTKFLEKDSWKSDKRSSNSNSHDFFVKSIELENRIKVEIGLTPKIIIHLI